MCQARLSSHQKVSQAVLLASVGIVLLVSTDSLNALALNFRACCCKEFSSPKQYSSREKDESQSSAAAIEIWQCPDIMRAKLPVTEPAEMIWPTTWTNCRVVTSVWFKMLLKLEVSLSRRCVAMEVEPFCPFQSRPCYGICWVATHTDFSSLETNPDKIRAVV